MTFEGPGIGLESEASSPARGVLVVDDHALVREGMRAMLANEPGLEVVGEAGDGRMAVEMCRSLGPELVLMDVRMPGMDGLAATREIKAKRPSTAVLLVTAYESQDYLLDAIRAGAAGYVLKDATRQQLVNSMRRVLNGESPLNQELAMSLLRRLSEETRWNAKPPKRPKPLPEPLTARELDVVRCLALGKTNRETARDLQVSLSTIKSCVQHVLAKLEVTDRTQAAIQAFTLGLLPEQEE